MSYHVILAAKLTDDATNVLKTATDIELHQVSETPEAVAPYLADAHAIIVGDELVIDAAIMDAAPNLQLIGRAGASLTNIDVDDATRRGVVVMNAPDVDAVTVAEYTFTMILAVVRNIFDAHHDLLDGTWNRDAYIGRQLQGKTLGIMGYGKVGQEVASRAIAFGLDVLVSDPYVPERYVAGLRLKLVGTEELFARSDIITIHTSIVKNTKHIINEKSLALMKDDAFLVNVKHDSFFDMAAVRAALDGGSLGGVAIDEFDTETPLKDNPLIGHPRVIHTQRMRYNTVEAHQHLSSLIAPQVLDALRQKDYRNGVNLPFMPGSEYERIEPHLELGEKIGILEHALGHQAAIERVEISIQGDEMQGLLKPLTVAIVKGILKPVLGDSVNYINAPVIAHERGILVTQSKGFAIDSYPNLLTCRVTWVDGGELIIAGAIFNQTEPRIVQIDRYRTDISPQGTLLVMGGFDVPGVIGRVGTFMANHQINIAGWRTSRINKGGHTLSIIIIDEPLEPALLDELRENEFVRHATQITFD